MCASAFTSIKLVHPGNAPSPNTPCSIVVARDEIVICCKPLQFLNAPSPIVLTLGGMKICFNILQSANANAPIVNGMTLTLIPTLLHDSLGVFVFAAVWP